MKILIHRSLSFAAQCTKLNLRYHKGGIIKHTHSVLPQAQRPQTTTGELLRTSLKNEKVQNKYDREVSQVRHLKWQKENDTKCCGTIKQNLQPVRFSTVRSRNSSGPIVGPTQASPTHSVHQCQWVSFKTVSKEQPTKQLYYANEALAGEKHLYTSGMSSQEGNGCV